MNMPGTCVPKGCLRGRKRPEASSAPRMAKRGHPLANFIPLRDGQLALLEESYAALLRSVNEALVLQTRLKGYMDSIGLAVDEGASAWTTPPWAGCWRNARLWRRGTPTAILSICCALIVWRLKLGAGGTVNNSCWRAAA